ncbi:unnamed protein product [Brassica napus]|uniref:(rape) hypothetical protein n=1 Tax=Brassica napus TaxID=3708 RepID=A0A817B385_BRANA|nr:unnamed protein product [Brassica napus]
MKKNQKVVPNESRQSLLESGNRTQLQKNQNREFKEQEKQ